MFFSLSIAETLPPNSGPIQAELVGKIDAGRAKIGDAVLVKATRSIGRGSLFQTVDLDNQQISVYRVENGKRVFGFRLASPVPTKQSFGLSPDRDQLAVLSGDQISLYSLTAQ